MDVSSATLIHSVLVKNKGLALTNRYAVLLPLIHPTFDPRDLNVLCRATGVPGKNITTSERRTSMRSVETPTGYNLEPINMVFTETGNGLVQWYFDKWFDQIVDPITHEVAYRKDIAHDVYISRLSPQADVLDVTRLIEAYPKTRATINMSDEGAAEAVKVEIQMTYKDFETISVSARGGLDLFERISGVDIGEVFQSSIRGLTGGRFGL